MYSFLTSSTIHLNKLEAYAVKNMEVIKLSQSVGVALEVSYTHLGVLLRDTITLVTAPAKLGSYKPVYNFQYAKYNT